MKRAGDEANQQHEHLRKYLRRLWAGSYLSGALFHQNSCEHDISQLELDEDVVFDRASPTEADKSTYLSF